MSHRPVLTLRLGQHVALHPHVLVHCHLQTPLPHRRVLPYLLFPHASLHDDLADHLAGPMGPPVALTDCQP